MEEDRIISKNFCHVISEDEIDRALIDLYIRQGRLNLENGLVYCSMTGKLIGRYEKPIEREEFR